MGSGESGPMDLGGAKRSRSPSAASPAILWFLSHRWERNSPPAGGETPLRKEPSSGPMRASGPTKKRSIIAPSSAPFGGTYPYPLCRFATSPLDKGSRPPEGKALGGDRPLIRHGFAVPPSPPGGRLCEEGPSFVPGGRLEKCGGKLPCEKTDKELMLCRPKLYRSTPNSSSSRTS